MGILSNFIGGAAEAGGNILQRQRESDADLQKQQQYAKYNDDLARARELTTMELRKQYERERDQYLSSPEYIARQTAAGRAKAEGEIATNLALAPKVAEVEAAKFEAGKGTRKAARDETLEFALTEFRQKSAAELEADIKKMNDPKYLAGKAKEAAAGRDPASAALARVQLQSAQIALKEKQAEAKIPPAVKGSIAAIQKQADAISAAVTKAELDGSASPEAVQKYQARLSELNGQITKLYEPYLSERDRASIAPKSVAGGMQDVRVGGRVIGQAATPEEAASLVRQFKSGASTSNKPSVPGRPLYNESTAQLKRMADKPRGVSTAEANDARAELEKRKGESRMSGE